MSGGRARRDAGRGPRQMAAPGRGSDGTDGGAGRRLSPGLVFIGLALLGSLVYILFAITVRDASQIPLLASGAVVLAIVFGALSVYCLRGTWRAGLEARSGRAMLIALVGGGAAIVAAGCLAGAFILFQLGGTTS